MNIDVCDLHDQPCKDTYQMLRETLGNYGKPSEEDHSASADDTTDNVLGWAESFAGNSGETFDATMELYNAVHDSSALEKDTVSVEVDVEPDNPIGYELSTGFTDNSSEASDATMELYNTVHGGSADATAVGDDLLTAKLKKFNTLFSTKPSHKLSGAKKKPAVPKVEKKKDPLPFKYPITPADLFFLNNKPYVLDENYPNFWHCLDTISNLIAWIRKRLTKAAQLEVDSSKLRSHAQILSEHPDYRMKTDPFCKKDHVILMRNGVVDLSGDIPVLREPYIGEKFDWMVQADFIPETACPSLEGTVFEHFCSTSLDGDPESTRLLLEIIGYSISNTIKGKSFFILIGERDCGKSVIINFLGELFPPEQVTSFTLNQIADNRNTQQLCYGRLNISAENDEKSIKSVHIIKSCTGGDRISAGRRYHDNVTVQPCVHFVFAVNRMPDNLSSDTSDAFYRRMRPLIFPYSIPFEQQDPYLLDKLLEERDLIVTAGIWALHRVMHNSSSIYHFTIPESSRSFMQEYRENANSILTFIQDCLVFGPEYEGYSEDFYKAYKSYCDRNGLEKMSMKLLISQIRHHGQNISKLRHQENGVSRRGLHGVGFMK